LASRGKAGTGLVRGRIAMDGALGYPDWDYPVNQFERGRGKLEEFVT